MNTLKVSTTEVQPEREWSDPRMLQRLVRNVVENAPPFANSEVSFTGRYVANMVEILAHDDAAGVDCTHS